MDTADDRIADLEATVARLSAELAELRKAAPPPDEPVLKFDDEKRICFGYAYIARRADGTQVIDFSGDVLRDPASLESAAYQFVKSSRLANADHAGGSVGELVESLYLDEAKLQAMGLQGPAPVGWWTGFKIHDDRVWDEVKKGRRLALSIEGRGKRRPIA